jgi:acetyltransferase-like isoleucine patch superfamily enzyme
MACPRAAASVGFVERQGGCHRKANGFECVVSIPPALLAAGNGQITVTGEGATLEVGSGCSMNGTRMTLAANSAVRVGRSCRLAALEVYAGQGAKLTIGDRTQFAAHARIYMHEPARIGIGNGCLVAGGTLITASDMHSIIDVATEERINPPEDIVIEDAVWLGNEVVVLKGVTIGRGSVIGLRAVVSRSIPSQCLAVGTPARVVREGVTWRRERAA